ncbi:MAG: tetratricopeptide repeat protein [Verrucomicrobiales bacterium]|nr:tetratricopeptide repeat protein [Verrucomicrobiales bacterium]
MNFGHQNTTPGERISSIVSGIIALALIAWCVTDFVSISTKGGSQLSIFANALFAFAKGIAGVIIAAPSLARWALSPAFRCIDWIYSPGGYAKRPPLDYRLANLYRNERKFDQAIERYSEIIRYYPKEVSAHAWLFVLISQTRGSRKARKVYRSARRRLRKADDWKKFKTLVSERTREWC